MEWHPWDDFDIGMKVKEPPCKDCEHFEPTVENFPGGLYKGVRICQAAEMFPDFSCFKQKG